MNKGEQLVGGELPVVLVVSGPMIESVLKPPSERLLEFGQFFMTVQTGQADQGLSGRGVLFLSVFWKNVS